MAHRSRNLEYAAHASGQYHAADFARQACLYRLQIWLAAVIGVLTLVCVLAASPRQEVLLKSIQAQTIAMYDELVVNAACEMSNGQQGRDCRRCKINGHAERKSTSARKVLTCLIRKGTTKLQAALS